MREAARIGAFEVCYSSDLERDLPHASVFVYITRSEGLGSAALLAMARGVPVVASRVGGLPEIVEDGVNGMLVPNDPEAIACGDRRACRSAATAVGRERPPLGRGALHRRAHGGRDPGGLRRVLAC